MEFKVSKKPKKDTRKGYLLIIETMIGDADGEDTVEVGCFQKNELHLLEEVIEVCDRMIDAYPHGRGGDDDYNHVKGFNKWFTEDCYDDEDEIKEIEHLAPFDWSYRPDGNGIQNSIEGYKVIYLDNGKEYKVEIIK
jgi:hypothetical protein